MSTNLGIVKSCERCGQDTAGHIKYSWEFTVNEQEWKDHIICEPCKDIIVAEHLAQTSPSWTIPCPLCGRVIERAYMKYVINDNVAGMLCSICAVKQ